MGKRVAIIGAGFSGLAACWYALQKNAEVKVFDLKGIGGGASGMAAGLLHYYIGAHAKKNFRGEAAFSETMSLLEIASKELKHSVYEKKGILRLALSEMQLQDFKKCAELNSDVEWWESDKVQLEVPGAIAAPGIFLKGGINVNCLEYLKGLWQACQAFGAQLEIKQISQLSDLEEFDSIILATGINTKLFTETAHLRLTGVKGQLLEVDAKPPITPLNSLAYVVSNPQNSRTIIGATYEKQYENDQCDAVIASRDILPKAEAIYPGLKGKAITNCQSGIRVSTPDHLPMAKRISSKIWVFTGMGSKGLLYHALYAKELIDALSKETQ